MGLTNLTAVLTLAIEVITNIGRMLRIVKCQEVPNEAQKQAEPSKKP